MRFVGVIPSTSRLVRAAVGAGLTVALVVGGAACAGESNEAKPQETQAGEPTVASPESTVEETTATPTEESPEGELPEPDDPPSDPYERELYEATVGFYEAVTEAYRAMDPAPIEAVVLPGSGAGSHYLNTIKKMEDKGHRFSQPPPFVLRDFEHLRDGSQTTEVVTFHIWSLAATEVDEDGNVVKEDPGGTMDGDPTVGRITLTKGEGDKWLVASQTFDD